MTHPHASVFHQWQFSKVNDRKEELMVWLRALVESDRSIVDEIS